MNKVRVYKRANGGRYVGVMCPGCGYEHAFTVDVPNLDDPKANVWSYNEDAESPTFTPSMLVFADTPRARCHSFVTAGKIIYQGDCFHELKNRTVDLPEIIE